MCKAFREWCKDKNPEADAAEAEVNRLLSERLGDEATSGNALPPQRRIPQRASHPVTPVDQQLQEELAVAGGVATEAAEKAAEDVAPSLLLQQPASDAEEQAEEQLRHILRPFVTKKMCNVDASDLGVDSSSIAAQLQNSTTELIGAHSYSQDRIGHILRSVVEAQMLRMQQIVHFVRGVVQASFCGGANGSISIRTIIAALREPPCAARPGADFTKLWLRNSVDQMLKERLPVVSRHSPGADSEGQRNSFDDELDEDMVHNNEQEVVQTAAEPQSQPQPQPQPSINAAVGNVPAAPASAGSPGSPRKRAQIQNLTSFTRPAQGYEFHTATLEGNAMLLDHERQIYAVRKALKFGEHDAVLRTSGNPVRHICTCPSHLPFRP